MEERRKLGKSDVGKLTIEARLDDGNLVIEVRDDGRGIDWDQVREAAQKLGVEAKDPADLHESLFRDALTTRCEATDVSGRGLGLGAFRRAVTRAGGRVAIETTKNHGTTVRAYLPQPAGAAEAAHEGEPSDVWRAA
jgi:two-component system chemotaxis sensor kinase CheA